VTPCSLVVLPPLGALFVASLAHSLALRMDALRYFEASVNVYQTVRILIPQDGIPQQWRNASVHYINLRWSAVVC
jgi:hypothetical protein